MVEQRFPQTWRTGNLTAGMASVPAGDLGPSYGLRKGEEGRGNGGAL